MNRLIVLGIFFIVPSAHAASFDCAKASTTMEKAICSDASLSVLDEKLNEAYRQSLVNTQDRKTLISDQRQWLRDTAMYCQQLSCLKAAYQTRLLQLTIPWQGKINESVSLLAPFIGFVAANEDAAIITSDGTLWAWGEHVRVPLNNGAKIASSLPQRIGGGYAQVAPGGYEHIVALKMDGTLWGWGNAVLGQLGKGEINPNPQVEHPAGAVFLGSGFVSAAAGQRYTFAIRKDGTLWQWGGLSRTAHGEVTGEVPDKPVPLGRDFIAVSAREEHFAAIKKDGSLWLWGNNFDGQLGIGSCGPGGCGNEQEMFKIGDGYTQVSVGYSHTAAIKSDGSLWVWGHNGVWGKVGSGTKQDRVFSPTRIGDGFTQVAAGYLITAAIKKDGSLWMWGGNPNGIFGDCTTENHSLPVRIGEEFVQVATGHPSHGIGQNEYLLALKKDGTFWTWGWKWEGKQTDTPALCRKGVQVALGDGLSGWSKPAGPPVQLSLRMPVPKVFNNVSAGETHSAMVKHDGTLWTWGDNSRAQLADGTTTSRNSPKQVDNNCQEVNLYPKQTLVLRQDHSMWCWGCQNSTAQKTRDAPVQAIEGIVTLVPVDETGRGLAIKRDRTLWSWLYYRDVYNGKHPLSAGQQAGSDISEIAILKYGLSIALRRDGTLWHLQQYPINPVVQIGKDFVHIASKGDQAYGVKADGSLWAWGDYEQLGKGTTLGQANFKKIGDGFVQVLAGRTHALALKADGTLWSWGKNDKGQLGDGTTLARSQPMLIGRDFAQIAVGDFHNLAIKTDGSVWAWGDNTFGQLGDGTNIFRPLPARIVMP